MPLRSQILCSRVGTRLANQMQDNINDMHRINQSVAR